MRTIGVLVVVLLALGLLIWLVPHGCERLAAARTEAGKQIVKRTSDIQLAEMRRKDYRERVDKLCKSRGELATLKANVNNTAEQISNLTTSLKEEEDILQKAGTVLAGKKPGEEVVIGTKKYPYETVEQDGALHLKNAESLKSRIAKLTNVHDRLNKIVGEVEQRINEEGDALAKLAQQIDIDEQELKLARANERLAEEINSIMGGRFLLGGDLSRQEEYAKEMRERISQALAKAELSALEVAKEKGPVQWKEEPSTVERINKYFGGETVTQALKAMPPVLVPPAPKAEEKPAPAPAK